MTNHLHIQRLDNSEAFSCDFGQKERQFLSPKSYAIGPPTELNPNHLNVIISHSQSSLKDDFLQSPIHLWIHPNSGYDNFSAAFVEKASFPIICGHEIRGSLVHQYILRSFLNYYCPELNQKTWERAYSRTNIEKTKTLLIGHGLIGQKVAHSLQGLGGQVSVYDPYQGYSNLDFSPGLFDALILCASLNPSSRNLVDDKVLSFLGSKSVVINTARGGLMNQESLRNFLQKNLQSLAVLDVFEKEPEGLSDFQDLPNVVLTSHIAGMADDLEERVLKFEKKVIQDFLHQNLDEKLLLRNRISENFLI